MDLLADIDPVYAVLVVHLRHGYGVDTTHHNTRQGQQDLCNGIDSLALDPGRLAFQIVIDREKAGVRPGVSADPLVAGSDSNASNERKIVESVVGIAENTRSHQIGMDLSGNIPVDGNAAIRVSHLPHAVQTQSYG